MKVRLSVGTRYVRSAAGGPSPGASEWKTFHVVTRLEVIAARTAHVVPLVPVEAASTVYVGDQATDLEAARAAGIHFIGMGPMCGRTHRSAQRFEDIPALNDNIAR